MQVQPDYLDWKNDNYSIEDLLFIRDCFDKKQVFYDILEPQNHEFKQAIGIKINH